MKKEKIILLGGGGHCRSCIDVIEQEGKYEIAGIIDQKAKIGEKILGYPIIADDTSIPRLIKEFKYFFITLGFVVNPTRRIELFNELLIRNVIIPVIISPHAYVSPHTTIGKGTIIMHNSQVNAGAVVGQNCIVNSKALLEHDVVVQDHCHISTGSIVNGGVEVGSRSFIGSGSIIRQYIKVSEDSFVKANSLIKE